MHTLNIVLHTMHALHTQLHTYLSPHQYRSQFLTVTVSPLTLGQAASSSELFLSYAARKCIQVPDLTQMKCREEALALDTGYKIHLTHTVCRHTVRTYLIPLANNATTQTCTPQNTSTLHTCIHLPCSIRAHSSASPHSAGAEEIMQSVQHSRAKTRSIEVITLLTYTHGPVWVVPTLSKLWIK